MSEDFEGEFPGEWEVFDRLIGYGEYYWGKRDCRPHAGTYSGWAVGGGSDGHRKPCGGNYPDYANSWMVYGPFSLADATAAELEFQWWLNSDTASPDIVSDAIWWCASIEGQDFHCQGASDPWQRWIGTTLDLGDVWGLGNLMGEPEVWVALVFQTGTVGHDREGCYVDDIVVRKCTSGTCPDVGGAVDLSRGVASGTRMMARLRPQRATIAPLVFPELSALTGSHPRRTE